MLSFSPSVAVVTALIDVIRRVLLIVLALGLLVTALPVGATFSNPGSAAAQATCAESGSELFVTWTQGALPMDYYLLVPDASQGLGSDLGGFFGTLELATGRLRWELPIASNSDRGRLAGATVAVAANGLAIVALDAQPEDESDEIVPALAVAVDLATGELMWTLTYAEFEALLVSGKGAGAVFMTGVVGQEASLLAIDV